MIQYSGPFQCYIPPIHSTDSTKPSAWGGYGMCYSGCLQVRDLSQNVFINSKLQLDEGDLYHVQFFYWLIVMEIIPDFHEIAIATDRCNNAPRTL